MNLSPTEIDEKLKDLIAENDPVVKLQGAERVLQDSLKSNYELGMAAAYVIQGTALWQASLFPEAMNALDKALAYLSRMPNCQWHVLLYFGYGNTYRELGVLEQALERFLIALKIANELQNEDLVIKAEGNIGVIAVARGDYKSGIEAFLTVQNLAKDSTHRQMRITSYVNLAAAYYYAGDYPNAVIMGQNALLYASAPVDLIGAHGNLGSAYAGLGDYEKAKHHLENSFELAKEARLVLEQCVCCVDLADYHIKVNEDEQAIQLLNEGLNLAQAIDFKAGIRDCHQRLHTMLRKRGDWERALFHHERFHDIDKNMFNDNSDARMRNLDVLHKVETARRDAEIYQLRNIELLREIEERKRVEGILQEQAIRDPLTGLFNRRHFFFVTDHILQQAKRYQHPTSIVMIDLDYFKQVNDTYGHAVGDKAIKLLAEIVEIEKRASDISARFGGDEFVILMPETSPAQAQFLAERLRQKVAESAFFVDSENSAQITLSIGIGSVSAAELPISIDALLEQADQALYKAKKRGRNQVQCN